jgi:hypothetical protein
MTENRLFAELCKPEVMKIGWHLAQLDSRDDFFADALDYADFASNLGERLEFLVQEVKALRYRPRDLINVDVPKSGLSVRPGNVLPIDESIVLHAIVFLLAPKIDPKLSANVYSYRLHKDWEKRAKKGRSLFHEDERELPFLRGKTIRKFDPIEPWYAAWPAFDKARKDAVQQQGFTHLTKTDITAYFENIDLRLLDAQIRVFLPREPHLIQILMRILETWTRITSAGIPVGRGIPQGNDVSSFLGNIYLLPLDRALELFCRRRKGTWFRYVDDVDVYSQSYEDARDAVFAINTALRGLHLNLQGSKTVILEGKDLERELDDSAAAEIDKVWETVQKIDCRSQKNSKVVTQLLAKLRPIARRFRKGLPKSVSQLDAKNNRAPRRLMTVYGRCGRPYLRESALAALESLPEIRLLRKSLSYLGNTPFSFHDATCDRLLRMLEASVFPIPYQAATVLEAIHDMHPSEPGKLQSRIRKYAYGKQREWTVRQKAAEALSVGPGRESSFENLTQQLLKDDHPWVRRAACVTLTRCSVQFVRVTSHQLVYHPDPQIGRVAMYWTRHLDDKSFALATLGRLKKGRITSENFIRQVPTLWLLRACADVDVVTTLREHVASFSKTRSGKVRWHMDALLTATKWVLSV